MKPITIKTEIWKTGNSYVVTIPKNLVDLGLLREKQKIELEIDLDKEDAVIKIISPVTAINV